MYLGHSQTFMMELNKKFHNGFLDGSLATLAIVFTIKTPEKNNLRHSGVFDANFEYIQ